MDAVVLAAGRGERLTGIMPPFHKPLLVMNGEPLVKRAVRQAFEARARRVVVVAAPENALPLSQVIHQRAWMVLQREPMGPGDALMIALLSYVDLNEDVLVLMGDNYSEDADIEKIVSLKDHVPAVGIERMSGEELKRFTWQRSDGVWVEKVLPEDDKPKNAWVGPLRVPGHVLRHALMDACTPLVDMPISPAFNLIPNLLPVAVNTVDLGIPEMMP